MLLPVNLVPTGRYHGAMQATTGDDDALTGHDGAVGNQP